MGGCKGPAPLFLSLNLVRQSALAVLAGTASTLAV